MLIDQREELKVPEYLNIPWLTTEYVKNNGWYPEPDEVLEQILPAFRFVMTKFGEIPIGSRDEYRPGDVILFEEFDEWEDGDRYNTDRFYVLEAEDIEQYRRGERDLLPVGVVVHPPMKAV